MSSQKSKPSLSTNSKNGKQQLDKLVQCQKCSIVLLQSDLGAHECFNLNETSFFLFENMLHLNYCEHPKEVIKEMLINKEYIIDYAFINPVIMNQFNLDLGDLIWIQSTNSASRLTCLVWPSNQINMGQIGLNKTNFMLNLKSDQKLYISKLNRKAIEKSIEIRVKFQSHLSQNTLLNSDEKILIQSFLKEIYLNKVVHLKQFLFLNYLGQKLVFQVEQVDSSQSLLANEQHDLAKDLDEKLKISNQDERTTIRPVEFDPAKYKLEIQDFNQSNDRLFLIDMKTKLYLVDEQNNNEKNHQETKTEKIDFALIGGLEKEISLLKEFFVAPFEHAHLYKKIGVEFSKGVLLYGPAGCGKTLVARAIANETKCNFVELKIADIYSKNYGESELKLKNFFDSAWSKSPCIIYIDEIDSLCSRRENLNLESDKRIVSLFSNLVDQSKSKNILFLCTTNKLDMIDLSLRRPGRFDKEIEIPIPNQSARFMILKNKLAKLNHSLNEVQLQEVSQSCHGYVGADLEMLVQEAGLICINRLLNKDSNQNEMLEMGDFSQALRKVKPSAMREITFDIPKVYWSQIGGQHDLKRKLQQAIVWPLKHADSFKRLNIKPPRGILMYGPPGCSKTMIAKALATETGLNFIAVKGPELFSKWVGESERMVREIFRKARNAAPAIIFFDEIDAIAAERSNSSNKNNNVGDRVLAQMLNEIDGVENLNEVSIVAATNRPDMIDKALMRPGRLDRIVYVRLPDLQTRKEIFEIKLKQMPTDSDVNLDELAKRSEKYSGAEIEAVCNEAAFIAIDSDIHIAHVSMKHFESALSMVTPRTSDETINYFNNFSFNK